MFTSKTFFIASSCYCINFTQLREGKFDLKILNTLALLPVFIRYLQTKIKLLTKRNNAMLKNCLSETMTPTFHLGFMFFDDLFLVLVRQLKLFVCLGEPEGRRWGTVGGIEGYQLWTLATWKHGKKVSENQSGNVRIELELEGVTVLLKHGDHFSLWLDFLLSRIQALEHHFKPAEEKKMIASASYNLCPTKAWKTWN